MTTDTTSGAGAYKADRADQGRPFRLNLSRKPDLDLGYREVALAAGALGLGVLAYKGVEALIARSSSRRAAPPVPTGHLEPVPLARSASPDVKDNAAPRFVGEGPANDTVTPFVATSDQDDTADLVVSGPAAGEDRSAATAEHVPTDLMGDRPPTAQDRAIDAFRPDPTAPVPPEMRDSLRPATGPAPSLAADRGTFAQGLSQTDGSK